MFPENWLERLLRFLAVLDWRAISQATIPLLIAGALLKACGLG